jgi:hypothetical protein
MRNMRYLVFVALTFGAATFIVNSAGATTKTQVDSHLLSISNMPTGWSVDDSINSSSSIPCLKPIKSPTKDQVKASVAYEDGSLPEIQEVVAAGHGVVASYKKLNHVLEDCKSFTYSSGGKKITGNIGPLLFPNVGAHSNAYAINLNVQGASVGADIVVFETGRYVCAVLYENIGVPDLGQARAFVNEAVSRLEGKPVVVPTNT